MSDYNIYLGDHWEVLQQKIANYSKVLVLVDENTRHHCLPILRKRVPKADLEIIEIKSGEQNKNIQTCHEIWDAMFAAQADRKSVLINLGGGVIGDMGGFCASTFMRGIDFIQIPTTLLSQVDSSIGGKLGIDHNQLKNAVGLFQNPLAVFICTDFLKSLAPRQIKSGLAEMYKHGLIANGLHWKAVGAFNHKELLPSYALIRESLLIKKQVVERDFRESSYRKILNFGHTLGHAVETAFLHKEDFLLHGEAIAIGMIMEGFLSHKVLSFPKSDLEDIQDIFLDVYAPARIDSADIPHIMRLIQLDKKNDNGAIHFSLLRNIGVAEVNQLCPDVLIEESIQYYNKLVG